MSLHKKVIDYIKNSSEFDETLALEIVRFQIETVEVYRNFVRKLGIKKIKRIEDVPFMPVEFFKKYEIKSFDNPLGHFLSSGTTGQRSRVFYNENSLELYNISAWKAFPFKDRRVYSFIPPFEKFSNSSLAYMVSLFVEKTGGGYLNEDFEIEEQTAVNKLDTLESGFLVFLTSLQLLRLASFMDKENIKIEKNFTILETGGYKALKKPYNRFELYAYASKFFPKAEFYTEYGMCELFSQFYSVGPDKWYIDHPFVKVFSGESGLLRVFDFANLYTVSALFVPDKIVRKGQCFNVLGRITDEERGCAFTFG